MTPYIILHLLQILDYTCSDKITYTCQNIMQKH